MGLKEENNLPRINQKATYNQLSTNNSTKVNSTSINKNQYTFNNIYKNIGNDDYFHSEYLPNFKTESSNMGKSVKSSKKFDKSYGVDRQLQLVECIDLELEKIKVSELIKFVDPSFDSNFILDQIQNYESAIKNEIQILKHQSKVEKETLISKKNNEKTILKIKTPSLPNYIGSRTERLPVNNKSEIGKTKIDYKILVRSLENDIVILNHKVNDQKFENVKLFEQVEDIRKNVLYNKLKFDGLFNSYNSLEKEFTATRDKFKENEGEKIDKVEKNKLLKEIEYLQENLLEKKQIMCSNIERLDSEITNNNALKKYYKAELIKLEHEEKIINNKDRLEKDKYMESVKNDLEFVEK